MDAIDESRASFGGAEIGTDPRVLWAEVKARLGGNARPIEFSSEHVAVLNAAADQIIPADNGFPPPSAVDIVDFVGRYVTPESEEPRHYPKIAERDLKRHLDTLGASFAQADRTSQVRALEQLERDEPDFFAQLQGVVYYGYYSRPQVVQAIRDNLPAGRDYHGPPQPYGYLAVIEPWDTSMLPHGRGRYTPTEDVAPVNVPAELH
jgi:hypothetical protein